MRRILLLLSLGLILAACGGGDATEVAEQPGDVETAAPATAPPSVAATDTAAPPSDEGAAESEPPSPTEAPAVDPTVDPTVAPATETVVEAPPAVDLSSLPAYLSTEYVDVRTGSSFRITDHTSAGNYVLLEMMAVW